MARRDDLSDRLFRQAHTVAFVGPLVPADADRDVRDAVIGQQRDDAVPHLHERRQQIDDVGERRFQPARRREDFRNLVDSGERDLAQRIQRYVGLIRPVLRLSASCRRPWCFSIASDPPCASDPPRHFVSRVRSCGPVLAPLVRSIIPAPLGHSRRHRTRSTVNNHIPSQSAAMAFDHQPTLRSPICRIWASARRRAFPRA